MTHKTPRTAILASLFILLLAGGCNEQQAPTSRPIRIASGGQAYGGVLRMNIADNIRSIFPHGIIDASAFSIMNQVYEGLVYIEPGTNSVKPAIAETIDISPDGRTYKFKLRRDVYFHDDKVFPEGKGRQVTARDVAYCIEKLCEPSPNNQLYAFVIDIIKGGRNYYDAMERGARNPTKPTGIRVLSDFEMEIELDYAYPTFLTILAHPCCWIFPAELYTYGSDMTAWSIGTGPFRARTIKMNDVFIFEKNHNYWRTDAEGNRLPYLDAIRCNFIQSGRNELREFMNGNLDLTLRVPYDEVTKIRTKIDSLGENSPFYLLTAPGLRTEYYGFQHISQTYGNELVRRAFNHAVDRKYIVNNVLKGMGKPALNGFVPPSMPGYLSDSIQGLEFDPEKARELLAEAGYPGGRGFPVVTIQLNDGNTTALDVAAVVQEMLLKHLNLTIELAVLPRAKHYDRVEMGTVGFWRDGWIADFPDPENFLMLFYGKLVPDDTVRASYLNSARFKSDEFDQYFEQALREQNKENRLALMAKADREAVNNAAVIPLYHEMWVWLVNKRVNNLHIGTMGELNLMEVYIEKTGTATRLAS